MSAISLHPISVHPISVRGAVVAALVSASSLSAASANASTLGATDPAASPFTETAFIPNPDPAEGDWFGFSVDLSGGLAVVGAHNDGALGYRTGAAYLIDAATGETLMKLTASDAQDELNFGRSVAVSGQTVVVSADGASVTARADAAAYVFDASTGAQIAKLTVDGRYEGDLFGRSVAVSGDTAVMGAQLGGDNHGGTVYSFDTATGAAGPQLTGTDTAYLDHFGDAVAISGDIAIIGAPQHDAVAQEAGAAYLFDVATGAQLAKLTADDGAAFDYFGDSVAIAGDRAVVGAARNSGIADRAGAVYLFDVATGAQIAKLTAPDASAIDLFGASVAITTDYIVVGATLDDDAGPNAGALYVFDAQTGDFMQKLIGAAVTYRDNFASAVAADGQSIIAGTFMDSIDWVGGAGSAHLFTAEDAAAPLPPVPLPPVPLPGAAALLVSALGALALHRRRPALRPVSP